MSSEAPARKMSYAEYCAFERQAETKHEYVLGEVFAMTGGTLTHGHLAMRVGHLLSRELEGRPCRVFSSDVRVHIETEAGPVDTYPDVSVVCGSEQTGDDAHTLLNPCLLVEVLSPSTQGYDRGRKATHYRQIPSLRAYLLVAQDAPRLELRLPADDGGWTVVEAGPGERLELPALEIGLEVDELYRDPTA